VSRTCTKKEKLLLYAHQMLGPSEDSPVRAHLAGCAPCREIVESHKNLSTVLDEWKAPESWPWFDARLRAAIAKDVPPRVMLSRWNFNLRRWTPVLGMAAVTVFAVCAMLLVNRGSKTQVSARQPSSLTAQRESRFAGSTGQAGSAQIVDQPASEHSGIGMEEPKAAESTQAEDDEMLSNFDVLSELPRPQSKQVDN
jgi:Putative zinc-finger